MAVHGGHRSTRAGVCVCGTRAHCLKTACIPKKSLKYPKIQKLQLEVITKRSIIPILYKNQNITKKIIALISCPYYRHPD